MKPVIKRLLRVETSYYVAGAEWARVKGVWFVARTAPILLWMHGLSPEQAKHKLLKRGASWSWISL